MTGQDIVDLIRAEVVEPNPAFFTTTALINLMNSAQRNYVRRTRCLQNFATTSTVQGQADYPMPTDWLGAEKVLYNNVKNGVDCWYPLEPTSVEKLSQESPNFLSTDSTAQGTPRKYYIVNKTLYVYPRPMTSGSSDIYMFYESKPIDLVTLADDISVDDSLADGIQAYMLWKMWAQDGEPTLATEQKDRFKDEVGQGLKWKKKQVLDGRYKIDIQSHTGYSYGTQTNTGGMNPLSM